MKTLVFVLGLFCLSLSLAESEEIKADFSQPAPVPARETAMQLHRNIMQRIFGVNVSYSGVFVPQSKKRTLPFTMTSTGKRTSPEPFANVSIHPLTGRAEGLTLLSINF